MNKLAMIRLDIHEVGVNDRLSLVSLQYYSRIFADKCFSPIDPPGPWHQSVRHNSTRLDSPLRSTDEFDSHGAIRSLADAWVPFPL